jgi:hypothetical protein
VGQVFLAHVFTSHTVLSAIVSQVFPLHHYLYICSRQDFASALETYENRLAMNFPDSTIITVVSVVTPLYWM